MRPGARRAALSALAVVAVLLPVAPAPAATFFADEFDGTALDQSRWDTALATSGRRWCGATVANGSEGQWQDPSIAACHGQTQSAPFGSLAVGGGEVALSAGAGRASPYFYAGPPVRQAPIPSSGDFAIEARMRFDSLGRSGAGMYLLLWPDSRPEGSNGPSGPGTVRVFVVWPDPDANRAGAVLLDGEPNRASPNDWHTYRVEYSGDTYTLSIDGLVVDQRRSSVRPNSLWFGNPYFTFWSAEDWADPRVDYVRVTVPDPPPPPPPPVAERLPQAVVLTGRLSRRGLRVRRLRVRAPAGSRIEVSCAPRRCRRRVVRSTSGRSTILRRVARRTLRRGTRLRVKVTKPGFAGVLTVFRVVRGDVRKSERQLPPS